MRFLSALLLLSVTTAIAQQAPYHEAPAAEAPYYRVRYEASATVGELIFPVQYTIWIPPGVETLRGVVVHQHGCGEGSCKSGLTGAFDLHWQALAAKHRCALMSPVYEQPEGADCQMWCDPRNGSAKTFLRSLSDLGQASGHPELATVPWALWGHSGGGHWVGGMTFLYPERVAATWLRSGVPYLDANPQRPSIKAYTLPDAALSVPMMCNLGTKEGVSVKDGRFSRVWPANETFFRKVRARGGLIGVAVDPLSSHDCGNQRYLAIPWLDACLENRLPPSIGNPLQAMSESSSWLVVLGKNNPFPVGKFTGNALEAVWLPNKRLADLWGAYVRDSEVPDLTPPPSPTDVRLQGSTLSWNARADVESGLEGFLVFVDGKEIARTGEHSRNRYGRAVFQGLQYSDTPSLPLVRFQLTDKRFSHLNSEEILVKAVNTRGLHSR